MSVHILTAFRRAAATTSAHVPPYHHRSACAGLLAPRRTTTTTTTARRPRNDKIPFAVVRLVDPETKSLHPPAPLRTVLAQVKDPATHHVELVTDTPQPIVRIVDTKAARERYKEQRRLARVAAKAQERKEIQLTWGVASGDFLHKLSKVRQELEKGRRVDLIFAPKKGQAVPTKLDKDARLKETLDALSDIGREYSPRDERKNIIAIHLKPLQ